MFGRDEQVVFEYDGHETYPYIFELDRGIKALFHAIVSENGQGVPRTDVREIVEPYRRSEGNVNDFFNDTACYFTGDNFVSNVISFLENHGAIRCKWRYAGTWHCPFLFRRHYVATNRGRRWSDGRGDAISLLSYDSRGRRIA